MIKDYTKVPIGIFAFLLVFSIALAVSPQAQAQTSPDSTVTYGVDDTVFGNPERGFYKQTEVHSYGYNFLNQGTLEHLRTNYYNSATGDNPITIVSRTFYLENFLYSDVSSDFLANMQADFDTARDAGMKVKVRFAYHKTCNWPAYEGKDASPAMVLTHIQNLKNVLNANADVVLLVQLGFVGAWGEWWATDTFAPAPTYSGDCVGPGPLTEQNWDDRRAVVNTLIEELSTDRMVSIRNQDHKIGLFERSTPLTAAEGHTGTPIARAGHFNDCFLSNPTNTGTYSGSYTIREQQKDYLNAETKYLPMGGETCGSYTPESYCSNAIAEMERMHWSYMNTDYDHDILGQWDECIDEVKKRLGYRIELSSGTYSNEVKPDNQFNIDIDLKNVGFAAPFNPRDVELVLRHQGTGEEYRVSLPDDPRFWLADDSPTYSIAHDICTPSSMPTGTYDMFLNLPDPYPSIADRPEFSIRLATTDSSGNSIWEGSTGYNNLLHTLSVTNTASSPSCTSGLLLSEDGSAPPPMTLTIESFDMNGNPLIGLGNEVILDGTIIDTGFTPESYHLASGTYTAFADSTVDYSFEHWGDGSTAASKDVSLNSDVTLQAFYSSSEPTGEPADQHTLLIESLHMDGASFPGFYTTIHDTTGNLLFTGFAPVSFVATEGETYTVTTSDYLNWEFDHWEDGSQIGPRDISLTSDTTISAYYLTIPPTPTSTVPDAPINLVATAVSSSQINLSWEAPTDDGGEAISGYQVEGKVADEPWMVLIPNTGETTTLFHSGLVADTTYTYRISAINAIGIGGSSEEISEKTNAPPPPTVSSKPKGLSATAVSESQIDLDWSAPSSDGGASISGYEIERKIGAGSWSTLITTGTETSHSDSGLSSGTTYTYRVSAINSVGTSASSSEASDTTHSPIPTSTVPDAPINLVTTAVSSSQVDLVWEAPTDDGGEAISGYQVEVQVGDEPWEILEKDLGLVTSYSHSGLAPDETCSYRVSAINSVGTSAPSAQTSATTHPPLETPDPDPEPPKEVTLSVEAIDSNGEKRSMWNTLSADGNTIETGFTSKTYGVTTGKEYTLFVADYDKYHFSHWEDGSTDRYRTIDLNEDTDVTAFYNVDDPAQPVSATVTVTTVDSAGNEIPGYYTTLWQDGVLVASGFAPETFEVTSGETYQVAVSDYNGVNFNHWEDGSTERFKSFTISSDTSFVAWYTP